MTFYDRVFRVPVWVIVDLPTKKTDDLIDRLCDGDGAYYQAWPAASFLDTVKELGRKGWAHVVNKPRPFILDVQFVAVAVARHVKNFFGENTVLPGTHDKPYQQALNRKIEKDGDFERLFNEVLSLETDTSLSQVFGLAQPKAKVYVSKKPCHPFLIAKLAGKTLTVSEEGGTVNVKGKKTDEIYELVANAIENALNH